MQISIQDAQAQLGELVRLAQQGDDVVVITRDGEPAVRLEPVPPARVQSTEDIARLRADIADIQARALARVTPGPDAAQSQDFLYDEHGLPA